MYKFYYVNWISLTNVNWEWNKSKAVGRSISQLMENLISTNGSFCLKYRLLWIHLDLMFFIRTQLIKKVIFCISFRKYFFFFFFRKWERRRDIYLLMMVLHATHFISILFINLIVTVNWKFHSMSAFNISAV